MLRSRFIPTLLLKGSGLYKTIKFKNETYVGDPINAVRIFNDKAVDELILLDIAAHRHGNGPNFDLIADIASEAFIPLCYGGGVSTLAQFERLFTIGIEKVAVNAAAVGDMNLVTQAARVFGSQSIVVGIDVRPATGQLYALGSSGRLYGVNTSTGAARPVDGDTIEVLSGLKAGDRIVVYSEKELAEGGRIKVVDRLTARTP